MVDEPSGPNEEELQQALERAADDGWPSRIGAIAGATNRAEEARRAIALLRAWHDAQPAGAAGYEMIVRCVEPSLSHEGQIRELTRVLHGMTALAQFLLANLERATGGDGRVFLASTAEQADQYFPNE